jgi:hypothetical protein
MDYESILCSHQWGGLDLALLYLILSYLILSYLILSYLLINSKIWSWDGVVNLT